MESLDNNTNTHSLSNLLSVLWDCVISNLCLLKSSM